MSNFLKPRKSRLDTKGGIHGKNMSEVHKKEDRQREKRYELSVVKDNKM